MHKMLYQISKKILPKNIFFKLKKKYRKSYYIYTGYFNFLLKRLLIIFFSLLIILLFPFFLLFYYYLIKKNILFIIGISNSVGHLLIELDSFYLKIYKKIRHKKLIFFTNSKIQNTNFIMQNLNFNIIQLNKLNYNLII